MESGFHFYEPGRGHGLPHDPFNAIVGPRPIGWISTHDGAGRFNLAPYSFFNAFAYKPPIIGFSSSGTKDTLRNARDTGEFVWNLATRSLAEQMNITAGSAGRDVSEFDVAALTPVPSRLVAAPRVAESPVALECRVTQIVQMIDRHQAPMPNWVVFGEVVGVHIARHLLVEGVYDTAAARPILRAGGTDVYLEVTPDAVFRMKRPG
jgi:flavin reductase (DIM6/NTAB) family NADH-FMN oxidoreductase RutF